MGFVGAWGSSGFWVGVLRIFGLGHLGLGLAMILGFRVPRIELLEVSEVETTRIESSKITTDFRQFGAAALRMLRPGCRNCKILKGLQNHTRMVYFPRLLNLLKAYEIIDKGMWYRASDVDGSCRGDWGRPGPWILVWFSDTRFRVWGFRV